MIFIDGSNLYHILKRMFKSSRRLMDFDFEKFSKKIARNRKLIRIYYYTAPLDWKKDKETYMKQQKFFD